MLLEVGLFAAGVLSGVAGLSWYDTWMDAKHAALVKSRRKAIAKQAAVKRAATKAAKKAKKDAQAKDAMLQMSRDSMLGTEPETADSSLYGRKANGGASWGT